MAVYLGSNLIDMMGGQPVNVTITGSQIKSGTTTSTTISTGLSSISGFIIYKNGVSATGLTHAVYNGSTTNMTYCSSYGTSWMGSTSLATGTASPTISGGTITWNLTNAAQGGFTANTTYNWIAWGTV